MRKYLLHVCFPVLFALIISFVFILTLLASPLHAQQTTTVKIDEQTRDSIEGFFNGINILLMQTHYFVKC